MKCAKAYFFPLLIWHYARYWGCFTLRKSIFSTSIFLRYINSKPISIALLWPINDFHPDKIYLKPFNTMIHRKNNKMALGPPTDFHNRILLINLVQKPTYPKNQDIIEILFFLTRSIHLGVGKNIANLISIIFL